MLHHQQPQNGQLGFNYNPQWFELAQIMDPFVMKDKLMHAYFYRQRLKNYLLPRNIFVNLVLGFPSRHLTLNRLKLTAKLLPPP